MKRTVIALCASISCLTMVAASAETAPELAAKTLANNAAEQIKKNGVDAACKTFADPNGGFIEGELYVFVHDMNAKMICHAANPKLNGKDLLELKDADGKYFEKTIVETIKSKGSGWVDYRWINPTTHEIQAKSTYVESVNNVIIGVGIYKK